MLIDFFKDGALRIRKCIIALAHHKGRGASRNATSPLYEANCVVFRKMKTSKTSTPK